MLICLYPILMLNIVWQQRRFVLTTGKMSLNPVEREWIRETGEKGETYKIRMVEKRGWTRLREMYEISRMKYTEGGGKTESERVRLKVRETMLLGIDNKAQCLSCHAWTVNILDWATLHTIKEKHLRERESVCLWVQAESHLCNCLSELSLLLCGCVCVCECGHTFLHQCVCMRVRRWLALRRVSPSSSLALFLPQSEDRHIFCPLAAALPWITFGLHECNWGNPASPWKVSKTWSVRKAGMWECFILCLFYWNQFFFKSKFFWDKFWVHWRAGHFHDLPEFPWCNLTTLFVLCEKKQKQLRA